MACAAAEQALNTGIPALARAAAQALLRQPLRPESGGLSLHKLLPGNQLRRLHPKIARAPSDPQQAT